VAPRFWSTLYNLVRQYVTCWPIFTTRRACTLPSSVSPSVCLYLGKKKKSTLSDKTSNKTLSLSLIRDSLKRREKSNAQILVPDFKTCLMYPTVCCSLHSTSRRRRQSLTPLSANACQCFRHPLLDQISNKRVDWKCRTWEYRTWICMKADKHCAPCETAKLHCLPKNVHLFE